MTEVQGAARRARKRDNAARLGKLQTAADQWLNTRNGQLFLVGVAAVAVLASGFIGR
jgi:hypothetical protein